MCQSSLADLRKLRKDIGRMQLPKIEVDFRMLNHLIVFKDLLTGLKCQPQTQIQVASDKASILDPTEWSRALGLVGICGYN